MLSFPLNKEAGDSSLAPPSSVIVGAIICPPHIILCHPTPLIGGGGGGGGGGVGAQFFIDSQRLLSWYPAQGWSSAYTVEAVILQIQATLVKGKGRIVFSHVKVRLKAKAG